MTIELWTKPNCPACTRTQTILRDRGLEFRTRSLVEEPALVDEAKARGFSSAPIVITDDDAWAGFRPDKLIGLR